VHLLVMVDLAVIGLLLVSTALMQRMSRVIGALFLAAAAVGLSVGVYAALGIALHVWETGGLSPVLVEATFLIVAPGFFFGMARAGWLLLVTDATSRAICADQWGDVILGRPAALHCSLPIARALTARQESPCSASSIAWMVRCTLASCASAAACSSRAASV
jgi:hypothetical protein